MINITIRYYIKFVGKLYFLDMDNSQHLLSVDSVSGTVQCAAVDYFF